MREIKWKFEGGRIQNGELFKFFVGWLFRQVSPWTGVKTSTQLPQCHVLCWLSLSRIPHSLLPSPEKNPSQWAVNSASFPTEVRLVAMISISPLAILALETDSFALLGQLCILYAPPPSASDHTRIWCVKASTVSTSFFHTCAEMLEGERKGCLGESCLSLTYWAHIPCTVIWEHDLQTKQRTTTCSCRFQTKGPCGYSNLSSLFKVLFHAQNC